MLIAADQEPSVPSGCLLPAAAQAIAEAYGRDAYWSEERKKWLALSNPFVSGAEEMDILDLWCKMLQRYRRALEAIDV